MDTIISDISSLRLLGKDPDLLQADTPGEGSQDLPDDEKYNDESPLNPSAKPFTPSRFSATPIASIAQRQLQSRTISSGVSSPLVSSPILAPVKDDDDIEMGELAEEPGEVKSPKRKAREDLEEGEASDGSSPLSAAPDYV